MRQPAWGRVRDDAITVALEEMPEEGLDQPLRLDKLANEVAAPSWALKIS